MIKDNKRRFITNELSLLTLKATLATRNSKWPVYKKTISEYQRQVPKNSFRNVLHEIEVKYSKMPSMDEHISFISRTSEKLSLEIGLYLHEGKLRIGVAQKLINLHLKYLWCAGFIDEPHHCPIDGIIRDIANLDYDWISNDNIDDYKKAISKLQTIGKKENISLAGWELVNFRRR